MIADVAQSIRTVIRTVMSMPDNSVVPEDQLSAGAGTETKQMATVKVIASRDVGWPSITRQNVDGTPTSQVTENHDQIKEITASVNFYRGGNPDNAGLAQWTLRAMDDASRVAQRLLLTTTEFLMVSLGLTYVDSSTPRDLTSLVGTRWKSRGQVDLKFYVVNRESDEIQSVGQGTIVLNVDANTKTIEVST